MSFSRVRARLRRDEGFTLVEVLVTISLVVIAGAFISGAIVQALHTKVSSRQLAVAVNWVRAVDKAAGSADYADLGFYTGQQGAPTSSALIQVPANSNSAPLSEHPIVLGEGALVRSTSFTVSPSVSVAPAAPDPSDSAPLSDADASYKIETWVTAATPVDGTSVSPGKRVTVRVQWGSDPSQFDGSCRPGKVRCTVQSIVRPADAATADPVTGSDAGASAPCQAATPAVCDTYVRSGRVLGAATLTEGGTLPAQIDDVDLSARTTQPASAVTASWTFSTASGPFTVNQPLTGDDTGTRWAAKVPADPVTNDGTGTQLKGKIRPGQVTVTFAAAFDGASATATTAAAWSYTIPADAVGAHVTASLSSPAANDSSWCSSAGTGTPVVVHVTGLSVGFTETARPTTADDSVDFLFTVTDPGGAVRTVSVPATVVPGTVMAMTDSGAVDDAGNYFAAAAKADWKAVAPASTDCTPGGTVLVRVHRAADQSTTVLPVHVSVPGLTTIPGAPSNLRLVSVTGTTAVVAWDTVPFAIDYTVSGAASPVTTTTTQATVSGAPGQNVTLTVSARSAGGTSAASAGLAITFQALPTVPTGLQLVSVTGTAAVVAWDPVAGALDYTVSGAGADVVASTTQATIHGSAGQTVQVTVKARNAAGTGDPTAALPVTFQALPTAPTGLRVTSSTTSNVTVAWTAVAGATGYQVTYAGNSTTVSTTQVTIPGSPGATVAVTVAAQNASGTGPGASINATLATGTVAGFTVSRMYGLSARLSWTAFPGATGYRLTAASTSAYVDVAAPGTTGAFTLGSNLTTTMTISAYNSGVLMATAQVSVATPSSTLFAGSSLTRAGMTPTTGNVAGTLDTRPGSSLVSIDGTYALVLQSDGNLVLYNLSTGAAYANTHTQGSAADTLIYQGDGNVVLYGAGVALRNTGTGGTSYGYVGLQTDSNLVVYDGGGTARWALYWWTSNPGAGANFMVAP